MQLTWKASSSASAMHAVHAFARGWPLLAPAAADVLAPLVEAPPLAARGDLPRLTSKLLEHAAGGIEQNDALAKLAITQLYGRDQATELAISSLAAWIEAVEQAYFEWHRTHSGRQLADEIVTRTAPLRSLFDARGPGLLREIGRQCEPMLIADSATIVMVLPVLGGHGDAHPMTNAVTLEAVLTNVDESLPEVVRLAWLLAQLQFDLPAIAETLPPGRNVALAPLAMLPPALAAAEQLELAELSASSLSRAARLWRIASSDEQAAAIGETLMKWWTTYQSPRPQWIVALQALDQLL